MNILAYLLKKVYAFDFTIQEKIILNLIWINFVLFIIAYLINNYVNYSIDYVAFHQGGNAMLIFLGIVDYVKWSRQKN